MPLLIAIGIIVATISVPMLTGQTTFGQRCSKVFEPSSSDFEMCVQRLVRGDGVHFEIRRTIVEVK